MKDLRARVDDWVAEGIITAEQGETILAAEEARPAPRKTSLVAEALGYLGASLALIAAFVIVAQFWPDLEIWARLTLVALASGVLWAAGAWVRSSEEPSVRRLAGFLWFLSAAGVAFFAGLLSDDVAEAAEETVFLAAGLAGSVYSALLWGRRPLPLQQLSLFAALVMTVVAALAHLDGLSFEFHGLAVWAVGLAWATLAWGGWVPPQRTAYVLGSLALLGGAQVFAFDDRTLRLLLGLATALGLLGAGVGLGITLLLGFGAAGIFLFVPQVLFEYFGDTLGGPVALFLTGIVLLAAALLTARLKQKVESEAAR